VRNDIEAISEAAIAVFNSLQISNQTEHFILHELRGDPEPKSLF